MDNRTIEEVRKNETKLIEEIKSLEKQLEYLRSGEYYNQLRFENEMLQQVVDTNGVPSEVYDYIDCTHRNTDLLKENQELKEKLDKYENLEDMTLMMMWCIEKVKDENKELKIELSGYRQAILNNKEMLGLKEQNQGLKKQLEEKENIACNWKDSCLENAGKIEKLENQQKEFIKYLEDEIKQINPKILDDGELNLRLDDIKYTQYLIYKEVLQKYRSIIGGNDV